MLLPDREDWMDLLPWKDSACIGDQKYSIDCPLVLCLAAYVALLPNDAFVS
jgi:hypothetical protein